MLQHFSAAFWLGNEMSFFIHFMLAVLIPVHLYNGGGDAKHVQKDFQDCQHIPCRTRLQASHGAKDLCRFNQMYTASLRNTQCLSMHISLQERCHDTAKSSSTQVFTFKSSGAEWRCGLNWNGSIPHVIFKYCF